MTKSTISRLSTKSSPAKKTVRTNRASKGSQYVRRMQKNGYCIFDEGDMEGTCYSDEFEEGMYFTITWESTKRDEEGTVFFFSKDISDLISSEEEWLALKDEGFSLAVVGRFYIEGEYAVEKARLDSIDDAHIKEQSKKVVDVLLKHLNCETKRLEQLKSNMDRFNLKY